MKSEKQKSDLTHSPIKSFNEDYFNRERFVQAIEKKIEQRSKTQGADCETIGIYGKWGEGKTSVLNLVKREIRENPGYKNIRLIDFNPWFFKDQESLLLDFFSVLQKGVSSKDIKDKIKRYAPLVSLGASFYTNLLAPGLGGLVGKGIQSATDAISASLDRSVDELKKEVDLSIRFAQEHIVIFIDDVDRLDKDEMHTLFKLIKQTADFVNTTYVIAMDVDMVAKSIGSRFEDGSTESGRNFIEKIVQYPLYLPKIEDGHIYKMLIDGITETCNKVSKNSDEKETYNALPTIVSNIYPLFKTAREVLLFLDSFSFIYGFTHDEVEMEDLIYLEVLKLFQNQGYIRIRDSKDIVTGRVSEKIIANDRGENKRELDVFLEKIDNGATDNKHKVIKTITHILLNPIIERETFDDPFSWSKSICSPKHFDRYFTYQVADDIISDTLMGDYRKLISANKYTALKDETERLLNRYGYNELTRMVKSIWTGLQQYNLKLDSIKNICDVLSRLSVNELRTEYTETKTIPHIEFLIVDIINKIEFTYESDGGGGYIINNNKDKHVKVIKSILEKEPVNYFKLFLIIHFVTNGNAYSNLKDEFNEIFLEYIKKFISQEGVKAVFNQTQHPLTVLLRLLKESDPEWYHSEVESYVYDDKFDIFDFLNIMISKYYLSQDFETFKSLFDIRKVHERIEDRVKDKSAHTITKEETGAFYFSIYYKTNYDTN